MKEKQTGALRKVKAELVSVTLTLGQIDALVSAAQLQYDRATTLVSSRMTPEELADLTGAMQKLDEAVNL